MRNLLHLLGARRLLLLLSLLRDLETLAEDRHEIKAIPFQVDALPLQVVIDGLLLLADDFAASGDFLQQDLHHVHLTDGETLHFGHGFLHLEFVLGRLEILQLAHDGRRRVSRLPAGQYFAHLSRVELKHRVLTEGEAFVDLAICDLGRGAAVDALDDLVVGAVHRRIERGVALVVRHRAQRGCILHHQCVTEAAWLLGAGRL